MKALILSHYGKSDNVAFADVSRPVPNDDEVLIEVHAAGINPIDNAIPKGTFKPIIKLKLPATMASDVAGIVIAVGKRVTRFKEGDAVFASVFESGSGALAEFAIAPESSAALKPANLDFVQAASIPMVGLTSLQALKERLDLRPGQKVFIPAGSGGIGTFAIQLAKVLGAQVGTTTSTTNIELVRGLGADEVIDYKKQKFEDVLEGYDAVLGTVPGDALEKSLRILKPNSAVVSLVGPPDADFARRRGMNVVMTGIFSLLSRKIKGRAKKRGVAYSFLFARPDGRQLAEIGALLDAGRIRPVIDKVFPFEQAKEALAYLEKGRAKGKVVVRIK